MGLFSNTSDTSRPRIFQIGFNRCGTKSFTHFFEQNGLKAVHWRGGALAAGIEVARREGKPLLTYMDDYDVYLDMEKINVAALAQKWMKKPIFYRLLHLVKDQSERVPIYAARYFKELDAQYPGSKFILNTRDVDRWAASRLRFNEQKYRSCRHGDHVHTTEEELVACWKEEWAEHHAEVLDYFKDRPKDLLVFNIEKDTVEKIIAFFEERNFDPQHWGRLNQTAPK